MPPREASADMTNTIITMNLAFTYNERLFVRERFGSECSKTDEIIIEIYKGVRGVDIEMQ